MNAKKRYDGMIESIENGACKQSADDLMEAAACESGYCLRDLNMVVRYLTGKTLRDYVKERKLMAAYRYLITEEHPDMNVAVEISGFDNQSSFTKRFSSFFGMPPKEASHRKDKSLLTASLTWDEISCDMICSKLAEEEAERMEEKSRFGISQDQYAKIKEASELEEIYGFDPMFSQIAFEVAESLGIPMKKAFQFMDMLRDFGGDFSSDEPEAEDGPSPEEELRKYAFDPFLQFVFFQCGLSVDLAYMMQAQSSLSEEEIMRLDPVLVYEYAHAGEMQFKYFRDAYTYYTDHADDLYSDNDFHEYVDMICAGLPKEIAFSNLLPMDPDDDGLAGAPPME